MQTAQVSQLLLRQLLALAKGANIRSENIREPLARLPELFRKGLLGDHAVVDAASVKPLSLQTKSSNKLRICRLQTDVKSKGHETKPAWCVRRGRSRDAPSFTSLAPGTRGEGRVRGNPSVSHRRCGGVDI